MEWSVRNTGFCISSRHKNITNVLFILQPDLILLACFLSYHGWTYVLRFKKKSFLNNGTIEIVSYSNYDTWKNTQTFSNWTCTKFKDLSWRFPILIRHQHNTKLWPNGPGKEDLWKISGYWFLNTECKQSKWWDFQNIQIFPNRYLERSIISKLIWKSQYSLNISALKSTKQSWQNYIYQVKFWLPRVL